MSMIPDFYKIFSLNKKDMKRILKLKEDEYITNAAWNGEEVVIHVDKRDS